VSRFVLGLDLGQAADYSALSVLEREAANPRMLAVRHLVRFPPGTSYATVGTFVATVVRDGGLGHPPLVTDLTAVGSALLPGLRPAVRPAWIVPVMLTAGKSPPVKDADGVERVPKRDLVTMLQLLLQDRRLRVTLALPEAATLFHELTAFRAKVSLAETDAVDWRDRPTDDLVLAVALAGWWATKHARTGPSTIGVGGSLVQDVLDRVFPVAREAPSW
jgi:hypothetical protein